MYIYIFIVNFHVSFTSIDCTIIRTLGISQICLETQRGVVTELHGRCASGGAGDPHQRCSPSNKYFILVFSLFFIYLTVLFSTEFKL